MRSENKGYREGYIQAFKDVHDSLIPIVHTYRDEYFNDENVLNYTLDLKTVLRAEYKRLEKAYEEDYDTGVNGRVTAEDFK